MASLKLLYLKRDGVWNELANKGSCFFFGLFSLASCGTKEPNSNKIIVVHARGASFAQIETELNKSTRMEFLRSAYREGRLRPLKPIDNAVTISNIASFETGAMPSIHGIVGHTFGEAENQFSSPISGFSKTFAVSTFWEDAAARGQTVLNIGALITHGHERDHDNVDVWAQGRQLTGPQVIDLQNEKVTVSLSDGISFSAALLGEVAHIESVEGLPSGLVRDLRPGEWTDIPVGKFNDRNAVTRMQFLASGKIYVRGIFINQGLPSQFLDDIDNNIGGSTGWPDIPMFSEGAIGTDTIIDEINKELDRVIEVFEYARSRKPYDLILIDYPAMDRYSHAMLALAEFGTADETDRYKSLFSVAYDRVSRDFAAIAEYAANNNYELLITSGHGFSAIHTALNLNAILEQLNINAGTGWQVHGMPGKVSAHIYVSDQNQRDKEQQIGQVRAAFEKLVDPKTGENIVDKVAVGVEIDAMGLNHERAGDLFVMLKPGYIFQPQFRSNRPIFDTPVFKGDHGYANDHPESQGMVISRNKAIRHVTDIAGHVDDVLRSK